MINNNIFNEFKSNFNTKVNTTTNLTLSNDKIDNKLYNCSFTSTETINPSDIKYSMKCFIDNLKDSENWDYVDSMYHALDDEVMVYINNGDEDHSYYYIELYWNEQISNKNKCIRKCIFYKRNYKKTIWLQFLVSILGALLIIAMVAAITDATGKCTFLKSNEIIVENTCFALMQITNKTCK